jgi:hypothetical protein
VVESVDMERAGNWIEGDTFNKQSGYALQFLI